MTIRRGFGPAFTERMKIMKKESKRIGRPPITSGDLREKKSVTLRRSTWAALEGKRLPGESLAACIDRLLSEAKR